MRLPNPTASVTDTRHTKSEPSHQTAPEQSHLSQPQAHDCRPPQPISDEFVMAARGVKRRGEECNNDKASKNRANVVTSNAAIEESVIKKKVVIDTESMTSLITEVGSDGGRKARLIDAIIEGNTLDVLAVLEEEANLASCVDDKGRSLLNLACLYDRFSIVRFLRGFEIDVDLADENGITPLHAACMKSKNPDLLHFLVRQGASIDSVTSSGRTILHDAAMTGNVTGIVFALARGIHVDVRTDAGLDAGLTPLAYAFSFCQDKKVFKILIKAGADVGFVDTDGCTMLHFAALHNNLVAARVGIVHGLKVGSRNNDGKNCLAVARGADRCCKEIWDLLKNAGRRELSDCSFCKGKAQIQFKPCLHRVSCGSCCSGWSKCFCGAIIKEKSDVMEDPLAFDEALKNKDCFIQELVQNAGRQKEEIGRQMEEIWRQKEEIGQQEKEIGRQEKEIGQQMREIGRQEEEIGRQKEEIWRQEKEIGQQKREIGRQKREIARQKEGIGRQKEEIGRQKEEIGQREEEIGRQEKEMGRQEKEIGRQKEEIGRQKEEIGRQKERAEAMEASLKRSETERQELIEDKICAICLDASKDIIFASCGHSACSDCQTGLQLCHVCRAQIGIRIRFF